MSKRRRKLTFLSVCGVAAALTILAISRLFLASAAPTFQLDQNLVTALVRVGLSPECLAAAGVSPEATTGVVNAVDQDLTSNPTAISQADGRCFQAKTDCDRLQRLVQSGLGTASDVTACQQAIQELDAASTARKQTLDALFAAGTTGLSAAQRETLERMRANQASWSTPLEFSVIDRSQQDWVRLRQALANERISAKAGEDPDPGDEQYLTTCRSDSSVSAAKTSLDANLSAVKTAWESAASQ